MTRVDKIKSAIEKLTENEFTQLRQWFMEKEWQKWDEEIKRDSDRGKLDFLIKEAYEEKAQGKLKAL